MTRETASVEGREARLVTADIGASSEVLDTLGLGFVDGPLAARWLLRMVVSLLLMPGHDESEERERIERYIAPLRATHV